MIIIGDENIPYLHEHFDALGEVRAVAGRGMTPAAVRDADVLLVRSVTRVDRALLEGSRVRFVGTATAGTEHVDVKWLSEAGIEFADAAGSNAQSVANYVAAALAHASAHGGRPLRGAQIGIIGFGHTGSRAARAAMGFEMNVVPFDPPFFEKIRQIAKNEESDSPLALPELKLVHALASDYVTLHVPLTDEGPYATRAMIGERELAQMPRGAVLIHACRGGVVVESALKRALTEGHLAGAIIDVWQGEPAIDQELMEMAMIATPHIAGYSIDGKLRGTSMLRTALCRWLKQEEPTLDQPVKLPAPALCEVDWSTQAGTKQSEQTQEDATLRSLVLDVYPIQEDSRRLREVIARDPVNAAAAFDACRKEYQVRREFDATHVVVGNNDPLGYRLLKLGFNADN